MLLFLLLLPYLLVAAATGSDSVSVVATAFNDDLLLPSSFVSSAVTFVTAVTCYCHLRCAVVGCVAAAVAATRS